MKDRKDGSDKSGNSSGRDPAPSTVSILAFFTVLAVACVGGYFLLMKLIDISRQEDCMLAGRRNCAAPITLPADR
jgi:hypothetical protein